MNRVAGVVIFVFALFYGLEAWGLKSGFGSGVITPRSFPLLLAVCLGATGVAIFFSKLNVTAAWPAASGWLDTGVLLVSFVAYAYLLVPIGFVAATALETGLVSQRFGAKPWQALVTGLLVSVSLYALFVFALSIPLPVGRIFGGR